MRVIEDVTATACDFPDLVLTIGNFDGFHRGHRFVVEEVNRIARARGGTSALMSLWPHPRTFFDPDAKVESLFSRAEKRELLASAGLDVYFVLPFNDEVARMDRESFLRDIVLARCRARSLVVGHDFSFGAGARGDFDYLQAVSDDLGLEVVQLPPKQWGEARISSTLIRERLKAGDLAQANDLLGRPYTLRGTVVKGRGLGRGLGYPTANIAPPENMLPAYGVYAARVSWEGREALGAVNIGLAPTIEHHGPMIEVHLLDTDMDLVGKELTVALHHRLRGEIKFPDVASLKAAIKKDIVAIGDFFEV